MRHETAIIDESAEIAADVEVGPYSIIGPGVKIGAGTVIGPHVIIKGPTVIGTKNRIFQFASIGEDPQDLKYHGEQSKLVIGDRNTNTNLRYKQGKNLSLDTSEAFHVGKPELIGLPKTNVSTSFAFARGTDFFAYPNNYNHYVRHYRDTFQHGGISMEEMIVPFITLSSTYAW